MPKVICTIPGAPAEIGGLEGLVKFTATDAGLVSDEISNAEAEHFVSIKGYALAPAGGGGAADTELDALRARAAAVGLVVDNRWKVARLTNEVEFAEKAAAEKASTATT